MSEPLLGGHDSSVNGSDNYVPSSPKNPEWIRHNSSLNSTYHEIRTNTNAGNIDDDVETIDENDNIYMGDESANESHLRHHANAESGFSNNSDDEPHLNMNTSQVSAGGWSTWTKEERMRYISYYIPILRWFPKYNVKEYLIGDVIAGLSVGAMLIPQSIAYAGLVDISPLNTLSTAFWCVLIYAFFGHSRVLSMGPEAATSVLLGESVRSLPSIIAARERGEDVGPLILQAVTFITLLSGLLTLLFGFLRLGFVDAVFSRPVLAGLVCAIGMSLIVDQTPKLLGFPACHECAEFSTIEKIKHIWNEVYAGHINRYTIVMGLGCVIFLLGYQLLRKKYSKNGILPLIPHICIMVIIATAISAIFDLKSLGVAVMGDTAGGFPAPRLISIPTSSINEYLGAAIILTVLGFVETQIVNKTIFPLKGTNNVSPNRELVALGMCHLVNAFMGGYTGFGSIARTKVTTGAGASTQVFGFFAAFILIMTMLFMLPLFKAMPSAVTASILFTVGMGILETHELIFTFKTRQWMDFAMNVSMIIVTFFFGIDAGLFFAFAVCLLLVVKQQNKPAVRLLGRIGSDDENSNTQTSSSPSSSNASRNRRQRAVSTVGTDGEDATVDSEFYEVDESANVHQENLQGILIYQVDGPLFFSNAEGLRDRTRRIEFFGSVSSHPSEPERPVSLRGIIFDFTSVTALDATALSVLLEIIADYKVRNVPVIIVKLRAKLKPLFEDSGILEQVGEDNIVRSLPRAMEIIESNDKARLEQQENEQIIY